MVGVKSPISSCLLFSLSPPSYVLIANLFLFAFNSSLHIALLSPILVFQYKASGYSILNESYIDRFIQSIHAFKLKELLGDLTPFWDPIGSTPHWRRRRRRQRQDHWLQGFSSKLVRDNKVCYTRIFHNGSAPCNPVNRHVVASYSIIVLYNSSLKSSFFI